MKGRVARAFWIIVTRLERVWETERPRSPSFPPNSRINTSTGRFKIQSRRRTPPAVVSPLSPALTTRKLSPAARMRCSISAGKAAAGSMP